MSYHSCIGGVKGEDVVGDDAVDDFPPRFTCSMGGWRGFGNVEKGTRCGEWHLTALCHTGRRVVDKIDT